MADWLVGNLTCRLQVEMECGIHVDGFCCRCAAVAILAAMGNAMESNAVVLDPSPVAQHAAPTA